MREAGQRSDISAVAGLVTALGLAAADVEHELARAALLPTPFEALERELWGHAVDQSQTTPRMFRALAASGGILRMSRVSPQTMPAISTSVNPAPQRDWQSGRLLRLPEVATESMQDSYLLSLAPLAAEPSDEPRLRWVLERPWAYLLAQLVFAQDNWAAERITGSVNLELDAAQQDTFRHPMRVQVVVTTPTGAEVLCGSLGELIARVLQRLDVTLLGQLSLPKTLYRLIWWTFSSHGR